METIIEHGRFKDAPWYATAAASKIVIGGAGGIGSWLTILLARAGMKCYVFDDDKIEPHNLGGQLYGIYHVGATKVLALTKVAHEYAAHSDVRVFQRKIDEKTTVGLLAASCFDNMLARKHLFDSWVKANVITSSGPDGEVRRGIVKIGAMFIDGRLEAESMMIFCVTNYDHVLDYQKELELTDKDIDEANCTFKQTSYAAAMIAGHMTGFIVNHLTNVATAKPQRKVPYMWDYFIPLNLST